MNKSYIVLNMLLKNVFNYRLLVLPVLLTLIVGTSCINHNNDVYSVNEYCIELQKLRDKIDHNENLEKIQNDFKTVVMQFENDSTTLTDNDRELLLLTMNQLSETLTDYVTKSTPGLSAKQVEAGLNAVKTLNKHNLEKSVTLGDFVSRSNK